MLTVLSRVLPHIELINALTSGVLILVGWALSKNGFTTASVVVFLFAFVIGGFFKAKEGLEKTINERKLNVELLMILAAIGSSIIGYWAEGAVLIFIFALSGALETYTMNKSKKEIAALVNMQPDEAWKLDEHNQAQLVSVDSLKVGDRLRIKPGEKIPADAVIIEGSSSIDESAISGEPIPVLKQLNDAIFAGTVNGSGALVVKVTKENADSLFQKIISLVQAAQNEKSPSQQFIERFEGTYVKTVLVTVAILLFLPHYVLGWDWSTTFYRAMVFLVVASPCAVVASIMPATLASISNGARHGILFKGGSHLESLTKLTAIAFDKTGTLTQGKPVVTDFIVRPDVDRNHALHIVASIEDKSNHPLAVAITQYAKEQGIRPDMQVQVEDVAGFGMIGTTEGHSYKIGKPDFVGRDEAFAFHDCIAPTLASQGKTVTYIRDEQGIVALIALKDQVREEAKQTIAALKQLGITTIMLTGDNAKTAETIAKEAGIDRFVAECLPETKVEHLKELKKDFPFVGMVGDGINDAPALATATTGFAMGDGTDVALETADVVLMKNELTKIAYAVQLSRKMQRIVKQNLVFSVAVIAVLIVSNFLQVVNLPLGVIGHEGSTILVILNGLRMLQKV
ncbi:heavy metal translocating P-type ATPase [Tetzosporium hominis]|uniref:Heavy metal translocating P-type ATPase n=1 Tax=Tetzosporium hominis TaxID=2020506 RepID=A0A264VZQ6_9BACL|nr:heavy metal translocating P-type ATPase [Tetzosporium hominis]OZS76820.1 heavy metal translocating P-type ATPase [Tetzosporium hominis]